MLVTIPKPLVWPLSEWSKSVRKQTGEKCGFIEPSGKNAIEYGSLQMRLFNSDRFVIGLMVEAT
jgi:hypothetical protein